LLEEECRILPKEFSPHSILDAGTGSALVARYFRDRFPKADVVAVDSSQEMLGQAKANTNNQGIRFIESNLEAIQLPSSTYDFIVARYVLEHVSQPNLVCKEFFRVMKPGGTILLIDF